MLAHTVMFYTRRFQFCESSICRAHHARAASLGLANRFFHDFTMARRLTASESLHRVLELNASSEDDSDFGEDGDFRLPTALSDEELLQSVLREPEVAPPPLDTRPL